MRRHSRFPVAAFFGLALLILIPSPAAVGQTLPTFDTDHFLCYEAIDRNPNAPITISLDDQFCPEETPFCLENVSAMTALEFCNPTAKTVLVDGVPVTTPRAEEDLHLTFYELTRRLPTTRRRVVVNNQFGLQTLRVAAPRMVAVPTLKNGEGAERDLAAINHFTCYEASGKRVLVEAGVEDQFRTGTPATILVHAPQFLCNPAVKTRDGDDSPVPDENDHLVCYKVTPSVNPPGTTSVTVENQFEGFAVTPPETFQIGPLHFLCAPSQKVSCNPPTLDCPAP